MKMNTILMRRLYDKGNTKVPNSIEQVRTKDCRKRREFHEMKIVKEVDEFLRINLEIRKSLDISLCKFMNLHSLFRER